MGRVLSKSWKLKVKSTQPLSINKGIGSQFPLEKHLVEECTAQGDLFSISLLF